MGFNKDYLPSSPRTGHCIHEILHYFTKNNNTHVSLCNIFICLMCCSLRTPRTVGDLFCFFLKLGEKMNNGSGSPNVAEAIKKEAEKITWSTGSCSMTKAAHDLAGKKHNGTTNHTSDATLYTLHDSECNTDVTCGKYLDPLASNIYSNFIADYADIYLSRIVYLTDVFKKGLQTLLDDFRKLQCSDCGCKNKGKDCHYPEKPKMEQRELLKLKFPPAQNKPCSCPSIVQCHGTLSLLYQYGFVFYSARSLNGYDKTGKPNPHWLRQCKHFCIELQKLLFQSELFRELLDAINLFLFCIRQPFLLYLLTFWLVAILYFSYGLTIPLDLLHIRSHWRRALSHQISVLALLSKKAMSPTKVGYFTP
ncbi:uncharacterized protein BXIN_2221 [Babesia sp. Xinjiang]|uniref:uncharacterized protein n=1 Tax=Babesia sp. Xinjiang TaxID=462227 RepID=UPI000A221824|nr:uncharacterized protein BXIN_2221 [Babesia sp. Xinjiang]ORM40243.1 hypothetical protein BXIN_2221 [Babesia sp. Xinjiang]